jgi:hypothetical protein
MTSAGIPWPAAVARPNDRPNAARKVRPLADMVRAVVQTGPRQMEMREYPRPVLGGDTGALLRVEACGICGSDVEQYKGAMGTRGLPMIPGHEPLGIIEEITDETAARWGVQAGDRVAVEILIPCRSCARCLAGNYMNCRNRIGSHGGGNPPERQGRLTGGYAEYIDLHPNSIVHPMRGDIPAEIAVMYNPLGAGVRWALIPAFTFDASFGYQLDEAMGAGDGPRDIVEQWDIRLGAEVFVPWGALACRAFGAFCG